MSKIIGIILLVLGTAFVSVSAVGLFNSRIDSRVALLIALGAAGLVLFPIGLGKIRAASRLVRQ